MAAAQSLFFTLVGGVAALYHGQIRNIRSNPIAAPKCLDIENHHYEYDPGHIQPGTAVQLWSCNGKWNQDWKFSSHGETGQLFSTQTPLSRQMCLAYSSVKKHAAVTLEFCNTAPAGGWNWKYDHVNKQVQVQSAPSLCLGICTGG